MHRRAAELIAAGAALEAGDRVRVLGRRIRPGQGERAADVLARAIYDGFHLRRRKPAERELRIPVLARRADPEFAGLLAMSNRCRGFWSAGWRAAGKGRVSDGAVTLAARPAELRGPPEARELWLPSSRPYRSAGYFMAISEAGPPPPGPIVRLYLNLAADAAPLAMARLSSMLRGENLPGVIKMLNRADAYDRADAGVLYLAPGTWPGARGAVLDCLAGVTLRRPVSVFATRLAPGIGLAWESPEEGGRVVSSLGERLARRAAQAIAGLGPDAGRARRTEAVAGALATADGALPEAAA